ncbi:methyltransferase domain-containing protein [Fodinicurvata halophila]|uniref:Methyltransferase domain-containing protein n=1 Tax=Fodinicurvata halophila TaxID=1419723 RepID=A0ABV8UI21_9PROT
MDTDIGKIVRETKAYYDGAADEIYRDIWGENIHIGYFSSPDESLIDAMVRSNEQMADRVTLGPNDRVLDVGCGYGALARFLARRFSCEVLATNISDRELAHGRELTAKEGLDELVSFEWADFHDLQYEDNSFDSYWSQEAFLHAVDKERVVEEAYRVLKPGGTLVFTDLLVRKGTPQEDREKIYDRVKSPDMWDTEDYMGALKKAGFSLAHHADWSENVAPTYNWVRTQLENRRKEFERRIGKQVVDKTSDALKFWVDSGNANKIGWEFFLATKPH